MTSLERTNELEGESASMEPPEIVRSLAEPNPAEIPVMTCGEFVNGLAPVPLSITELIAQVSAIGGQFVYRDEVVVVEAQAPLPEAVLNAAATHQKELRRIIPRPLHSGPSQASLADAQADPEADKEMTAEEFYRALREMRPPS